MSWIPRHPALRKRLTSGGSWQVRDWPVNVSTKHVFGLYEGHIERVNQNNELRCLSEKLARFLQFQV